MDPPWTNHGGTLDPPWSEQDTMDHHGPTMDLPRRYDGPTVVPPWIRHGLVMNPRSHHEPIIGRLDPP